MGKKVSNLIDRIITLNDDKKVSKHGLGNLRVTSIMEYV